MKIKNKKLLITGGTGSFGNAVLNRFLHTDHFNEIRIFSRDEKKQNDMRILLNNEKLKFYIGDVRDYKSIEKAMRGVDYVFHAAFLNQIKNKEAITVTDPKMTRFLMSLNEAVELVLFAFEYGNQGDLFVNKAPAGTIGDLAQALKELCNVNNEIKIIGTRHGEKLYETLCTREEMMKAEDMDGFYRIPADNRNLNYASYLSEGEEGVAQTEDYHSHNTEQHDIEGMKKLLIKLDLVKGALVNI